jgi:predicted ATP-grasp superfamily ATP-dependent carboligase
MNSLFKITGAIIIEGHVQGLSNTRSLGEMGVPVYVIDTKNCLARYSKYCNKFFLCPAYNSDELADFLVKLVQKEKIQDWLLLPSNDHAVYTISKNKFELEKYFKFVIPPLEILDNIYDKAKLLSFAGRLNIPVPITQYFYDKSDEIKDTLTFPVLTKGRQGLSFYKTFGKKVFLAQNETELRDQLEKIGRKFELEKTFTQELIPLSKENKTVSFTAFCINGEIMTYWMGIKLREHPWSFGTATFAESVFIRDCLSHSQILLKSLNYSGICEVEYLLDPRSKEYKLIEINARTWLWVGLAKASGIDYAKILYKYVNNQDVTFPSTYTNGLKWINYLTDGFMAIQAIFQNKIQVMEYLHSLSGQKIHAVFSWNDLKPSIMFPFLA